MALDLLQLAGGRELIFAELHADRVPRRGAESAIVDLVCEHAAKTLHAELSEQLTLERELFTLMNGDCPLADVVAVDAWDAAFEAAILPVLETFVARGEVTPEWVTESLQGQINAEPEELDGWARLITEHMVKHALRRSDTVNKRLAAIGIVQADIDAAYAKLTLPEIAQGASDMLAGREPLIDFMTDFQEADGRAPAPEPTPAPTPRKRKRAHDASKTYILPSIVFQSVRALGLSEKEAAGFVKVSRSTWTRVASGDAEEMGLTAEQAAGLLDYLTGLRGRIDDILTTCSVYGLPS